MLFGPSSGLDAEAQKQFHEIQEVDPHLRPQSVEDACAFHSQLLASFRGPVSLSLSLAPMRLISVLRVQNYDPHNATKLSEYANQLYNNEILYNLLTPTSRIVDE
eukprot:499411-Amphidinium_carterae.2